MTTQKWRFPDNNYTSENGLDTSDMEMFKKDPVSSLAREICQNSIDAAFGENPFVLNSACSRWQEGKSLVLMIWQHKLMPVTSIRKTLQKRNLLSEN